MNEFIVIQQNYHWDAFISNEENKFEKDILMNSEYSFYKVLGTNERSNIGREINVGLEILPMEFTVVEDIAVTEWMALKTDWEKFLRIYA